MRAAGAGNVTTRLKSSVTVIGGAAGNNPGPSPSAANKHARIDHSGHAADLTQPSSLSGHRRQHNAASP